MKWILPSSFRRGLFSPLLLNLMLLPLYVQAQQSPAAAMNACLLQLLQQADNSQTVGELRQQCRQRLQVSDSESDNDSAEAVLAEQVVTAVNPNENAEQALDDRLAMELATESNPFGITVHRPNYILPLSYNSHVNEEPWTALDPDAQVDELEVKFQISLKSRISEDVLGGQLWGAYTQRSWWQLYNSEESAPFRETNYEPEIYMRWNTNNKFLGMNNRLWRFGFTHQSNGRGQNLSRSWNRLIVGSELDRGDWLVSGQAWWRIPEDEEDDDNPDILKYMGYGSITTLYKRQSQLFGMTLRNNLRSDNKGAVQLDWTFPLGPRFKGYVQYFNGYGESLIDYDVSTNRLGVGVLLNDWL